ncbi:uncharacterized protein TM35_000031690 [Trypanosoma theileri]|uniref:Mucin-associated surface protein (MASP) n=1 Tax=Trypanosoma theileri TaxID=67003 RepID=A0A1X0P650_9TRYP|nr:uncharacterized protein TM35_000031690 [Trypanosoma theileri]ORC92416.1 hypothetical protein TM35_000031690 [Trypanosoma theileri]
MAMKKMMGHVLCLLPFFLYCVCGSVMASYDIMHPPFPGGPGGILQPAVPGGGILPKPVGPPIGGIPGGVNPLHPRPPPGGVLPGGSHGVGRSPLQSPVGPLAAQHGPHSTFAAHRDPCANPGVSCPGGVPGMVGPVPGANGFPKTIPPQLLPQHKPGPAVKPAVPGPARPAGLAGSHDSYGMPLSPQLNGGNILPGVGAGQRVVPPVSNKHEKHPDESKGITKGDNGNVVTEKKEDKMAKVVEGELGESSQGHGRGNKRQLETVLSPVSPVKGVSISQPSDDRAQKKEIDSSDSNHKGGSGVIGTKGQQEQIKETTQGHQQDNHNTETNVAGRASTESHVTADSKPHSTTDASPSEITQSGLSTDDSNTLNNTGTDPNSTTDNVTTTENESTNGVATVGVSAEGNTTANTTSVTLNTTSNEVSTSPTTNTTTNTIPPIPAISNNTIMPNLRGDADSSSSISSSVWVRVPLLIVVTLACILVC